MVHGSPTQSRDPGRVPLTDPVPDQLDFTCPRCGEQRSEPWYGPCAWCRATLRAEYQGETRAVEAEAYVPKVNVTPNAVATKD